jgi:transposase
LEFEGVIQITPQMRILVALEAVDLRRGIDGLARICKDALQSDPFSGGLFVFRNRKATTIKVLVYDGQGFWLCQKRLSKGRFRWWPEDTGKMTKALEAHELQLLLAAGNPAAAQAAPVWRRVTPV